MNQDIVAKWAWQNSELCVNLLFLVSDLSLKHRALSIIDKALKSSKTCFFARTRGVGSVITPGSMLYDY